MEDRPDHKSLELVWNLAERRLEAQLRQADALDTKAGVLLGVQALGAPVLGSIAPKLTAAGRLVAAAAVLGLLLAGIFSFAAFGSQRYDRSPKPEELWRFARWPSEDVKRRFLSTRFEALDRNGAKLARKARNLITSLAVTGMVALLVGVTTIVHLVT